MPQFLLSVLFSVLGIRFPIHFLSNSISYADNLVGMIERVSDEANSNIAILLLTVIIEQGAPYSRIFLCLSSF